MLSVRIDGREVETTPVSLARLVLDGEVDRHSPAKASGMTVERSLEQSLESPHGEALSDELLYRLRSMYASESPTIDIQNLREQIERLCQWRWPSTHVAARFLWVAAWLNDMLGYLENAAGFYDAFLQTSSREAHLRLLAYNNRGVLRIRLGRLEGVVDLARAAVPESETAMVEGPLRKEGAADFASRGLPAACFNLLNLVNVSLESPGLERAVDEELTDFFSQIPEDVRAAWLGRESPEENHSRLGSGEESAASLAVLRDPTYRRLNALTTRLAARAAGLAGGEAVPGAGRLSAGASQLLLWESRSNGDALSANGHGADGASSIDACYGHCAEAASLLFSEDIPSSLQRLESPLARAERAACEELAAIENRLVLNQYELVRSRLEVQRRILSSLDRRGRLGGLLARVDAQLERVASLESQKEQLDLQRACAGLISATEQFCRLTDLCRAQRQRSEFLARVQNVRSSLHPQTSSEVAVLLDELTARVERHVHRLKRLQIRAGIRIPLRHLRRNWPLDWAAPVPETVYRALAQCQLSDPQCWVEDWAALKEQLDGHQGQHHLHETWIALQAGQVSWDAVKEDLQEALVLKPDLWTAIAPLFGLRQLDAGAPAEVACEIQMAIHASASRLFDGSAGSDGSTNARRDDAMHRAAELLERVFGQLEGQASRCVRLWDSIAATLKPVLEGDDLDEISRVRGLAHKCFDCWPAGAAGLPGRVDPRNPVSLFLESCEKAYRLVEAGRWLNAHSPRWHEAKACYGGLLTEGLDTDGQIQRAVTGYYLAEAHEEDTPQMQRHVLAGLEVWMDGGVRRTKRQVREQDVVREIARLRAGFQAERVNERQAGIEKGPLAGDLSGCPNDSTGGGHDPHIEGKSDA